MHNMNSIKNSLEYTPIETENNENIKNSQCAFYLTLKQIQPVLDRAGRSLCGKLCLLLQ